MNSPKPYFKFRLLSRYSRWINHPCLVILSHWLFQSIFYMDWSERLFKIMLDILLTTALWGLFRVKAGGWPTMLLAWLLAHTLNFIFNGHIWSMMKFVGKVHLPYDRFWNYVDAFHCRVKERPFIEEIYVYGSVSRNDWSPSSDFDVRLLRRPGCKNALLACLLALTERTRAAIAHFPLDLYIVDSKQSLGKMRSDESPLDIEE